MSFSPLKSPREPHGVPRRRVSQIAALSAPGLLALLLSGCAGGGNFANPSLPTSSVPTGGGVTGHYAFTDLGTVGATGTLATGISSAGVITGQFETDASGGSEQMFRHTGTTPIVLADALALPAGFALAPVPITFSSINAAGTVAGAATTSAGQDAFVYDTSFHDLGTLPLAITGRSLAAATAINDAGTVVGYDNFEDKAVTHAFRHTGTGPLLAADDLGTFSGYTDIEPTGINSGGVIVGTALAAAGQTQHAFVYDTSFHDLGTLPGCTTSVATGISRSGVVIGYGKSATGTRSFRHAGTGPLTAADDLGELTGSTSLAVAAINDGGDVVGNSVGAGGVSTACIVKAGGTLQSLSSSGLVTNLPTGFGLQFVTGINSKGQIVGVTGGSGGNNAHSWLLTLTP